MIEQAICAAHGGGYDFLARSPGFGEEWIPAAERLCTQFGQRPDGAACPGCVFAQPFEDRRVAVVQAADDAGRPGALGFRLLILPDDMYDRLGGDPFFIADQLPPDWRARGDLPALEWQAGPPPARTLESLRQVLDVPHSATLLGGVQALLDGSRLVFERPAPDANLLRDLWALLPTDRRSGLWPATFAFGNACGFDVVVTPRAGGEEFDGYLTEEQVGDHPEGAYEKRLQAAVEAGDRRGMDDLFAGRKIGRGWQIVICLAVLAFLNAPFVLMWLTPQPPATAPRTPGVQAPAAAPKPDPPPAPGERRQDVGQ